MVYLIIPYTAAQGAYLEFLERTNNSLTLIRCDDCASPAIILENKLVPFGDLQHSEVYVSHNHNLHIKFLYLMMVSVTGCIKWNYLIQQRIY